MYTTCSLNTTKYLIYLVDGTVMKPLLLDQTSRVQMSSAKTSPNPTISNSLIIKQKDINIRDNETCTVQHQTSKNSNTKDVGREDGGHEEIQTLSEKLLSTDHATHQGGTNSKESP